MLYMHYLQIGHDSESIIWWFVDGKFHTRDYDDNNLSHPEFELRKQGAFWGRYDPVKNLLSIVGIGELPRVLDFELVWNFEGARRIYFDERGNYER